MAGKQPHHQPCVILQRLNLTASETIQIRMFSDLERMNNVKNMEYFNEEVLVSSDNATTYLRAERAFHWGEQQNNELSYAYGRRLET